MNYSDVNQYKNKIIPFGSQAVFKHNNKELAGDKSPHRVLAMLVLSGSKGISNLDVTKLGYASLDMSDYIYPIRHKLNIPVRDEWEYTADGRRFKRWFVDNVELLAIYPPTTKPKE